MPAKFLGNLERPTPSFLKADQPVDMNNLPSFGVSILVPLIPAIIMISTTIANIWLVKDTPEILLSSQPLTPVKHQRR